MFLRFSKVLLVIIVLIMVFTIGCSNKNSDNDKIAYISPNIDSEYQNTFEELNLGILFDFNLKLPKADKSWVDIWVEGYTDGKAMDDFPIAHLSYGLSPEILEEGHMGFGIINPNREETQFFLYAPDVSLYPDITDNKFLSKSGISTWDYAIEDETIALKSGEEKVLAVYRHGEEELRTYDLNDESSINKIINEDKTVLLLKIKAEEKDENNLKVED